MEIILMFGLMLCIIVYISFSSHFSPIPFYPTNQKDLSKIIDVMKLTNNQIVFDLGAGSGRVIFAAAKVAQDQGLNTKFVAIDINIILNAYMQVRRFFHPNKKNIEIVSADLFKYDYTSAMKKFKNVVFYMYVSPWYTDPMTQAIIDAGRSADIISYYYPVKMLKKQTHTKGEHDIYTYKVS